MEENINQTPCAVQKIETSQGVSISYKEHLLYSKYNPSKNIIYAVDNLQLLPGTIILCFSPLLGYGLSELCNKIPENCLIVLCEAEKALYDFTVIEKTLKLTGERIIHCLPEQLNNLPLKLYDFATSGLYKRVIRLDMSAGVQFHKDYYDKLYAACSDSVMTFWKNRLTLTKFGRRYSKNLFENLHYLSASKAISDFFGKIDRPIIVFGAGESTQKFIDNVLLRQCVPRNDNLNELSCNEDFPFYILCADTVLQPLLKNGIRPDGVFVEEAQSVIVKAFTGTPKSIHIFAGLSSIPNLVHRAGTENLSYFFTDYAKAAFIDNLKAQDFMPPANQPFGSVGLTAVYYALKFRRDENIPVYIAGLDFSYSIGLTHTKGALAHILRLIHANRLLPAQNYTSAFGHGTEKISGKNGQTLITSPTLKSYAEMFKSFFGKEKNLFDAGESGIYLGLPHADMDCLIIDTPCKDRKDEVQDENHCEAAVRSNPLAKDIDAYLANERKSLEYLRDLLTGKTKLKEDELMSEITKIAAPREYLYLHFPDGYRFNTSQSFLNRIRTEIEFFLKYL